MPDPERNGEPPADAAPTTAAPDTPDGHTAILGRAWTEDGDITGAVWYAEPLPEVLLVDPAVAQVWAAARQWREEAQRYRFGITDHAERIDAALGVLAAAVDAAEAGRLSYTNSDIWGPEPSDVDRRREWAAALRWAKGETGQMLGLEAEADLGFQIRGLSGDDLDAFADRIESGVLTPWADQPDGRCGTWEPELGPCIAERPCSVHDQPAEAAPEPAGDGPGWDRDTIAYIIAFARDDPDERDQEPADQLEALLASHDRQATTIRRQRQAIATLHNERDAARAELAEQASGFLDGCNRLTAEREDARRELAEVTAERDRWRTAGERYSQEREDARAEVKAKERRIADILRRLDYTRAERDQLRESIKAAAERGDLRQEGGS